ncbi:MAG: proline dehydrogenase family protein [bacterium]
MNLKTLIISLFNNPIVKEIRKLNSIKKIAFKYIGEENIESFIPKMEELVSAGYKFTFSFLGEHNTSDKKIKEYKENVLKIIEKIKNFSNVTVSVKLTAIGLLINEEKCVENLEEILKFAKENNLRIHIDMESSEFIDHTLNIFSSLSQSYNNLDITFQAYLYRTTKDIEDRIISNNWEYKPIVRLCKGAYKEPMDKIFPTKKLIDENYYNLAVKMLDNVDKLYPAFATHDHKIIEKIKNYVSFKAISKDNFEFQMLYGVRPELQKKILEQGYNLRIYVPIGYEWYEYFVRRIAERPSNLLLVFYSLISKKE